MTIKTKKFDPAVLLDNPKSIAHALSEAFNDPNPRVLPVVLRDVARARGMSVASLAKEAGVNRESLYKTLKGNTDARWATVHALIKALGVQIKVAA